MIASHQVLTRTRGIKSKLEPSTKARLKAGLTEGSKGGNVKINWLWIAYIGYEIWAYQDAVGIWHVTLAAFC